MKTCTGCKETKELLSFPKDCARCKSCVNERRRKKYAACGKTRERNAAEYKRFTENNNRMPYLYQWRKDNPDKVRQYWGKEYAKNKQKYIDKAMSRERATHEQTPPWANLGKIEAIYKTCKRMTEKTGVPHEVDHIIPLRGENISGLNVETNLRIITMEENRRKSNKVEASDVFEPERQRPGIDS